MRVHDQHRVQWREKLHWLGGQRCMQGLRRQLPCGSSEGKEGEGDEGEKERRSDGGRWVFGMRGVTLETIA